MGKYQKNIEAARRIDRFSYMKGCIITLLSFSPRRMACCR